MRLVEDRELLRRFRSGEAEAMHEVFYIYGDELARFVRRGFSFKSGGRPTSFAGIGNPQDLHDIVAESFRLAFEQPARLRYSGTSPYGAYLKAIARNLVIDRLRSRASDTEPLSTEMLETFLDAAPAPQEEAEDQERDHLVRQFLATLAPEDSEFVRLRYQEDISQRDLATRLKKTRRFVRRKEIEIRKKIVRFLRGTEHLPAGAASE